MARIRTRRLTADISVAAHDAWKQLAKQEMGANVTALLEAIGRRLDAGDPKIHRTLRGLAEDARSIAAERLDRGGDTEP